MGWILRSLAHLTSRTTGNGRLEYQPRPGSSVCGCGRVVPVGSDGNVLEHVDDHLGPDRRITAKVTSGTAWGVFPGSRPSLSLNVQVTASNTAGCPVGRRGVFTLSEARVFEDRLTIELCGEAHGHQFSHLSVGSVAYQATTVFPPEKPPTRDLTPVRVTFAVAATRPTNSHGRARLAGGGDLRGPVSGKLTPVGNVDLVHTDAKADREVQLGVLSGFLRRDIGHGEVMLVARVERTNDPTCRQGKVMQVTVKEGGGIDRATLECGVGHAHLWLKGAAGHKVNTTFAVRAAT